MLNNMKQSIKFKIKRFFSNLWFKYVKKPYLNYLDKKEKHNFHKNVIKSFEKQFGVHPDIVKEAIIANEKKYWGKKPNVKFSHKEYELFLKEQLKKSAKPNNGVPFFYEPEIIDIHNESIVDRKGKTLNKIILEEKDVDEILLKKQQNKLKLSEQKK